MNTETQNDQTDAAGSAKRPIVERFVMWLTLQWSESLAKSIWDDLTPLGRATIWLPIWLLCWLSLPIILPIAVFCAMVINVGDKPFLWLSRKFFA